MLYVDVYNWELWFGGKLLFFLEVKEIEFLIIGYKIGKCKVC